jgi:hypothetical protein
MSVSITDEQYADFLKLMAWRPGDAWPVIATLGGPERYINGGIGILDLFFFL